MVKKLRLGTAVDSDLAIIIVVGPGAIVAYIITRFWPILLLLLLPLVMYYRHYGYWAKTNPTYLRSEKHEENMYRIQVGAMGEKHHELSEDAVDVLPNTETAAQLGSGKEKEQ